GAAVFVFVADIKGFDAEGLGARGEREGAQGHRQETDRQPLHRRAPRLWWAARLPPLCFWWCLWGFTHLPLRRTLPLGQGLGLLGLTLPVLGARVAGVWSTGGAGAAPWQASPPQGVLSTWIGKPPPSRAS